MTVWQRLRERADSRQGVLEVTSPQQHPSGQWETEAHIFQLVNPNWFISKLELVESS